MFGYPNFEITFEMAIQITLLSKLRSSKKVYVFLMDFFIQITLLCVVIQIASSDPPVPTDYPNCNFFPLQCVEEHHIV